MSELEELKVRLNGFADALVKAAETIEKSRDPIDKLIGQGPEIVAAAYRGIGKTLKMALNEKLDE
jgi:hypothetical protein